ncbi:MAG: hypothetical protein ACOZNI_20060 [Myxococcota bacterium]
MPEPTVHVPEVLGPPRRPLPGEGAVEDLLLHRAAQEINRLYARGTLETACRVGEYVLDTFFDGDLELFRSRKRKHATYAALCRSGLVQVTPSFVWYCVHLDAQRELFPAATAEALSISHHKLLVHVQDVPLKQELAEEAVREGLTRDGLAERIEARKRPHVGGRRGRPPAPAFAKVLTKLKAVSVVAKGLPIDASGFNPAEVRTAIEEAERALDDIHAYFDELQDILDLPTHA